MGDLRESEKQHACTQMCHINAAFALSFIASLRKQFPVILITVYVHQCKAELEALENSTVYRFLL